MNLIKGENFICLPNIGQFLFVPFGCHGYEQDEFKWEVGREMPVDLTAVAHDLSGFVFTSEQVPVTVEVTSHGTLLSRYLLFKENRYFRTQYSLQANSS